MGFSDGYDPSDVRQLTTAIVSGSTEAFAVFYEYWFDGCLESTMRMTGFDEATALDVVQDMMMKVATQLPRFHEERQLRAWLDRVLLNVARDRVRAESRRHKREQRPVHTELERMSREQLDELDRHLESLDDQQRTILRLRFVLGWSLQKIGSTLRLGGPGSIDGRIRRALEHLRLEYQSEEGDHD